MPSLGIICAENGFLPYIMVNRVNRNKEITMSWKPDSWRDFPIKQQPVYEDREALERVERELAGYPPLIFAGEARNLQNELARAGRGEALIVQGGDCAESFASFGADNIKNLFKLICRCLS